MIGVVLAGGASSRFGGRPKGLVPLKGRAMALYAADVLAKVCSRVAIEAPESAGYEVLGLPLLHALQAHKGKGPLAALATGLRHAKDDEFVAFAPCDMPLLDASIYRALMNGSGAYAQTADGYEPLVAVLPARALGVLAAALTSDDLPRTNAVLDAAGAVPVMFKDRRAFTNVNTPADLERLAAEIP